MSFLESLVTWTLESCRAIRQVWACTSFKSINFTNSSKNVFGYFCET